MITAELLERRIATFWGYGSLGSPVWFVGMEEGLGDVDDNELLNRLHATDGQMTVDVRKDMKEIPSHIKFFNPMKPMSQASLRYPIALYLHIKNGEMPVPDEVKRYQAEIAGDVGKPDSAILELMPLPAKSTKEADWPYTRFRVADLESRAAYLAKHKPSRVAKLKKLISKNKPQLIIFYSLQYRNEWAEVAGVELQKLVVEGYRAIADQDYTREEMPADWATTQNNLGIALGSLGDMAGDAKRHEEAVAAYRNALEVQTREDMPADWATTQNNLAMALKSLGQLNCDASMLEEARAAVSGALEIMPDQKEFKDTLQQIEAAIAELKSGENDSLRET